MPDSTALSMAEPQPKNGPALSATSDMPETKAAPPLISEERVPVDKTAETKTAKTEEAKPEAKAEGSDTKVEGDKPETGAEKPGDEKKADAETEGAEGDKADQTPAWMKAEITKQRNKARAAETRAADAERKATEASANLTKALEGIETLTKAQAAQISKEAEQQDPRPDRETFDTPEAYETALIDWAGRRAALVATAEAQKVIEADGKKAQDAETQKRIKEDNDKVLLEFADRKAKFVEANPDYEDVVENDDVQISIPMANAILTDEDGPAIAYYLGKNRDEAERISKLPAIQAVSALGRIAARIAAKPAPATKPAPLSMLKTGAETATRKTPAEESMEEYGARRAREFANEKRTRMGLAPLN